MTTIGQSKANRSKTGTYTSASGKVYTSNKKPKTPSSSSGSAPNNSATPPTVYSGQVTDYGRSIGVTSVPSTSGGSSSSASRASNYNGVSIVDFLNSSGQASDFSSRSRLAQENGISGYVGTAEQNTTLLNTLRNAGNNSGGGAGAVAPVVPIAPENTQNNNTPTPTNNANNQDNTTVITKSKSSYAGPSVTDYLSSIGVANDRASRVKLAEQMGVQGYVDATGYISGDKNLELLSKLRSDNTLNAGAGSDLNKPTTDTPAPEGDINNPDSQYYKDLAVKASDAGLSVTEFQKLIEAGIDPAESKRIREELGIPELEKALFAETEQSTTESYNKMYENSGLNDLKGKIQAIDDEVAKYQAEFDEAVGAVNENPWLSESTRVGRVKRLNEQLDSKIANKLEARKQFATMYDNGISEIEKIIQYQTQDFKDNQELNTAKLNYLLKQAEAQEELLKSKKGGNYNSAVQEFLTQKSKTASADKFKPFQVGDKTYQLDRVTGQFIEIASKKGAGESDNSEYSKALQFVQDNPEATSVELEQGIRANTKNLSESDIKSLINRNTKFLDEEYFVNAYSQDYLSKSDSQLKKMALDDGYRSWYTNWGSEKENYLSALEEQATNQAKSVMNTVEKYRKAGKTDEEILKLI